MADTGTQVGAYRILGRLGAGAAGVVYRARDERTGTEVALKLLHSARTSDRKSIGRFRREVLAASALQHPNIVRVFESGESGEGPFLAMELLAGRTLRALIGTRPALAEIAAVATQLGRALAATHALGIAHRDLKPENLFVLPDGTVKVLDFGLARLTADESPLSALQTANLTTRGTVVGTVRYLSPEQGRAESLTVATDLFSAGLVLFEWAAGRHPFASDFPMEVLRGILDDPAPDLGRWRRDLPPGWPAFVGALLSKEPAARPAASGWGGILGGLSPAGAGERQQAPEPVSPAPPPAVPPAEAPRPRSWWPWRR